MAGFGLKVNIASYAMPMLVFGVIMIFQKSNKRVEGAGWVLVGLGFLFLGIAYMKEGFEAVGGQIDLSQFAVPGFRGLLIYTGIGIAATVIMMGRTRNRAPFVTAAARSSRFSGRCSRSATACPTGGSSTTRSRSAPRRSPWAGR